MQVTGAVGCIPSLQILMGYLELRSMSATDVLVVDNAVSSVMFVVGCRCMSSGCRGQLV
jgi:hypothetical protein